MGFSRQEYWSGLPLPSPELKNSSHEKFWVFKLTIVKVKVGSLSYIRLFVTVHGIIQARILEWVAFPFSRRSSQPRGSNPGLPHCGWILYQLSHKGSPRILERVAYPFSRGSSQPRNQIRVSCLAGKFFSN